MAPGLIVATDTAFSSNRFAWTRQVHKVDWQIEPKVDIVPAIANAVFAATGKRLRKMLVDASLLSTSFIEGFRDDS